MPMKRITHWVNGEYSTTKAARSGEIYNPATGEVIGSVDFADSALVDQAVSVATEAFKTWRHSSLTKRTQVLFAFANYSMKTKKSSRQLLLKSTEKFSVMLSVKLHVV